MIYGFLLFILTVGIDLITDVNRYYKKRKVNHVRGAALRLIGLVPAALLLGAKFIPLILFAYWIIFEGSYNLLIGQKWNYIGETAKIDKLQRKYPVIYWLKYIGLAGSIIFVL